ncbi:MAG: HlyC/CorC family transporter [Clostridia bacterium]|nr:HlyC/CorC family transporter [Clostridia bacterium]
MLDDPGPANIVFKLGLLLVLILVNAFFAMSEIAIISLNDTKIRRDAEDGDKKAKKVLKLTEFPSQFLSTIQIGVTLAGFLTSASAAENFSGPLADLLLRTICSSLPQGFVKGLSTVLVTIAISFFSLVLGELAPKRIGMQKSEKIAFAVVDILLFVKAIMRPFIKILSVTTNLVVRMFGLDPNANEEVVTEEEILMMVDAGEEKGVIEESQKEMINNIFEFDDITASDVMTHRTDIEAVEIHENIDTVIKMAIEFGYSRIPVYEEELDDIKGILYVKDLLSYVGKTIPKTAKLSNLMREAEFVPESKKCGELFNEMSEKHLQMVFVCDEYGGIAGLVTMEDLLESIVGNMQDEYDNEEEEILELDDTTCSFDGVADIEEIEETLGIKFPEGDYDTIGGFIMQQIGKILSEDEYVSVEYEGYRFIVEEVDERRIERVRSEKLEVSEDQEVEE